MIIILTVVCSAAIAGLFVFKTVIDDQAEKIKGQEVKISELVTELNSANNKLLAIADLTSPYHD